MIRIDPFRLHLTHNKPTKAVDILEQYIISKLLSLSETLLPFNVDNLERPDIVA